MATNKNNKPDLKNVLGGNFNFGKVAEDIMGFVMNAGTEGRDRAKGEIEKVLHKMELVSRREFEAVREIAVAARAHAEELAEALADRLHDAAQASKAKRTGKTTGKKPAAKKTAARKPAAKKAPVKKAAVKKPAAKKAPVRKTVKK